MQLKWNDGIYSGEVKNGTPHGKGTLTLANGYKKGIWQMGVLREGIEYVDDTLYFGSYDENGRYHGRGYYERENVLSWQGEWEHGVVVKNDLSSLLPNCVFVGRYYGGIEPRYLHEGQFPHKGKVGRDGYAGYKVDADRYEMPLLSNAFGFEVVCAVEKHNNRWDYSKGYNRRALFFCDKNSPSMYTDAWVCKWVKGEYAPLTPQEAFDINNFIHETLAYENVEDFGKVKQKFADHTFLLLEEGIYKGDVDENGKPTGNGWIVYNPDDKHGRALYKGAVENGVPNGHGEMLYRRDAENRHYKGNFKNGLFHTLGTSGYGKATLIKQNGADWYGGWVDGEFEGDDNAIAIGGWAYERYDGKFVKSQLVTGSHSNPNDKRGNYLYEGEFLNFLPHGYGTEKIGEKSWTGYFAYGKRLVGDDNDVANAVELFDPCVAKSVNFVEFSEQALCVRLQTTKDKLNFVCNTLIETLGKIINVNLVLVITKEARSCSNRLVEDLFGVKTTGSCLLCGKKGNGLCEIPPKAMVALLTELQNRIKSLQNKDTNTHYSLTTLEEKHTSDWNVTRETHDDYPLEADHDFTNLIFYLMKLGNESYFVEYYFFESYSWDANHQDKEDFSFAKASVKAHKIPNDLVDYEQIKAYCDTHKKWTEELKHYAVRSQTEYAKINENGGFFSILISKLFGTTLTKEENPN